MKYINTLSYIVITSIVFLFASCADETSLNKTGWWPSSLPARLCLSSYDTKIQAQGGKQSVKVTSQNVRWKFEGTDVEWLELTPKKGESDAEVILAAQPNLDPTTSRGVSYMFSGNAGEWKASQPFNITQEAPGYYINAATTSFTKNASEQVFSIGIDANSVWKAQSDREWLKITQVSTTELSVHLDENTVSLDADRIGHITLTCGNATKVVTINQQPPNCKVVSNEILFDPEESEKTLEIQSEVAWSVSCSQPWIALSPMEGKAEVSTLKIRTAVNSSINERTGNVYISIGDRRYYSIPIRQNGMSVKASTTSLPAFSYNGDVQTLDIIANTDWTIIDCPEFITMNPLKGTKGTTSMMVRATLNNTDKRRSGKIVLGNANVTGLKTEIHVEQNCANLEAAAQTVTVKSSAGSSHQLALTTDQGWKAAFQEGTWVHVSPSSGNGSAVLVLTADENISSLDRQDTLTVTPMVSRTPLNICFIQKGKSLTVSTCDITFSSQGGSSDPLVISSEGVYSVTKSGDWFSLSQNGNTITVHAGKNDSKNILTGKIIISMDNLPEGETLQRIVNVYQYNTGNIEIHNFSDDKDWNSGNGSSHSIIIIEGFSDDKDWDFEKGDSNSTITIDGFSNDKDWNFNKEPDAILEVEGTIDGSVGSPANTERNQSKNVNKGNRI